MKLFSPPVHLKRRCLFFFSSGEVLALSSCWEKKWWSPVPAGPRSCCALISDLCRSTSAQGQGPLGATERGSDHGDLVPHFRETCCPVYQCWQGIGAAVPAAGSAVCACPCAAALPWRDPPFTAGSAAWASLASFTIVEAEAQARQASPSLYLSAHVA